MQPGNFVPGLKIETNTEWVCLAEDWTVDCNPDLSLRQSGFRGATPHLHPASVSHALSRSIDCESHPSQGPGLARLGSVRWMPRERGGWRSTLESLELAGERNVTGRGTCEFSVLEIYDNLCTALHHNEKRIRAILCIYPCCIKQK